MRRQSNTLGPERTRTRGKRGSIRERSPLTRRTLDFVRSKEDENAHQKLADYVPPKRSPIQSSIDGAIFHENPRRPSQPTVLPSKQPWED